MFQLTESDQQLLLQIARKAVEAYLSGRMPRPPKIVSRGVQGSYGIFVSIHRDDALRGCIGNVYPAAPLYRSAAECAVAAAVGDPRFMPMTMDELHDVHFEISVLSPMEPVSDISKIEIGTHGILVSKKTARGLLLPQVATAYGWDRERFLQETCKKAGLRPDDWKADATIHCFKAMIFDERQFQLTATT
jgi:AmmeMemoRadiSam system protein A